MEKRKRILRRFQKFQDTIRGEEDSRNQSSHFAHPPRVSYKPIAMAFLQFCFWEQPRIPILTFNIRRFVHLVAWPWSGTFVNSVEWKTHQLEDDVDVVYWLWNYPRRVRVRIQWHLPSHHGDKRRRFSVDLWRWAPLCPLGFACPFNIVDTVCYFHCSRK